MVQENDFEYFLAGWHINFKCDDPNHGKVVLPESMVLFESETEDKRSRQEVSYATTSKNSSFLDPPVEDYFSVNTRVQFSDPPQYGVIRWLGNLPEVNGVIAGVELVSVLA